MAENVIDTQEISMSEALGQAPAPAGEGLVSMSEVVSGQPDAPGVPAIADEHHSSFIQSFGQAIFDGMTKPYAQVIAGGENALADINHIIGSVTGLNAFQGYRDMVTSGRENAQQIKDQFAATNPFEAQYFKFIEAAGYMAPTIPFDVMTGAATKVALAGRILPKMEALLARVPNFVLGSGWRGMVQGIENAGDGNLAQQVVGGVVGAGEQMAWNTLYTSAGVGAKGVGKMAAMGLAQSFYNAAKEGRVPTVDEMVENTSQATMLGVVFSALPHLREGSRDPVEQNALNGYVKKFEKLMGEPLLLEHKPYNFQYMQDLTGQTFYHGGKIEDVLQARPDVYGGTGLYGEGLYLTDNPKVAESYARHKYGGRIASGQIKGGTFIDLEQPLSDDVYKILVNAIKGHDGTVPESRVGVKVWDALNEAIRENGDYTSAVEAHQFIAEDLSALGYAGFKHIGGQKVGGLGEHNVAVVFPQKLKDTFTPAPAAKMTVYPGDLHKLASDLLTDERIRPEVRESLVQPFLDKLEQRGKISDPNFELGLWKDRSKLRMFRETMERNIENVAGPDAEAVKLETTEKIKENETYHRRWQTEINTLIQGSELVGRGIKPNSKESAAVMRYGEGRMTEAALQVDFPQKWQDIKAAAEFCRKIYDDSLTAVNKVRARYNYEPIEKRADYFRHFQEINLAAQLVGHFLGGEKPPTSIAGVVNRTKYGKPFTSTELERQGGAFKEDAVLALQNYVQSVGNQMFHLDSVQRIRTLERYIRSQALSREVKIQKGQAVASLDLANWTEKLSTYADQLAGQPTQLTKAVNSFIDRPFLAAVRALQHNAVLNMIGANASAAFMNFLPAAQQMATTNPKALMKGWVTSALHLAREEAFVLDGTRSEFYDRRYPKGFLAENWVEDIANKGFVLPNVVDRLTVQALIAGKYYEGTAKGVKPVEAMKAADNYAVRVVTDRSTGQVPQLMIEQDLKLATAFQVEINNLWSWLAHDVPIEARGKLGGIVGRIAVFALASNVINTLYSKILGRKPQLDFIEMLGTLSGLNEEGRNRPFIERLKPVSKQLMGNVPFGNLFVEGGRFPIASALPDMNVILEDPEHRMLSEFLKPLYYVLPFGGGGQARKTFEGLQAWNQGYVATPSGNIRYEVQKDFYNFVRGFLFGKNAFPEAVKYWNQPKSERE